MEPIKVIPRVRELFDSTCIKQFEAMDCQLVSSSDTIVGVSKSTDIVTGYIDAISEELEIRLYITMSVQFLTKTMPVLDGAGEHLAQFAEDWCLELANRFLGRLKNKLISHRCVLRMGLPRLFKEDLSQISIEEGQELLQWQFLVTHDSGLFNDAPISCALVVNQINSELHLSDYEDEDEDWFEESELEHL